MVFLPTVHPYGLDHHSRRPTRPFRVPNGPRHKSDQTIRCRRPSDGTEYPLCADAPLRCVVLDPEPEIPLLDAAAWLRQLARYHPTRPSGSAESTTRSLVCL